MGVPTVTRSQILLPLGMDFDSKTDIKDYFNKIIEKFVEYYNSVNNGMIWYTQK